MNTPEKTDPFNPQTVSEAFTRLVSNGTVVDISQFENLVPFLNVFPEWGCGKLKNGKFITNIPGHPPGYEDTLALSAAVALLRTTGYPANR